MKKLKARTLRTIVTFTVLALVAVGYFTAWGVGNLSGFGWDAFSVLCPLGYLESLVAGKTFVPRAFLSFVLVVVLMVLFGRVFCAWICPMPTLQRLIPGVRGRGRKHSKGDSRGVSKSSCQKSAECAVGLVSKEKLKDGFSKYGAQVSKNSERQAELGRLCVPKAHITAIFGTADGEIGKNEQERPLSLAGNSSSNMFAGKADKANPPKAPAKPRRVRFDSRFGVLLGALASAAIFGFPVFCLICPVGLTFATVLLVMRLFAFGDVTWAVVVVPLVLLAEVVLLRKWCGKFCPLGALISLLSGANRTLRPHVNNENCLFSSKGTHCFACSKACPEHLDVRRPELSEGAFANCTKCRECADACPAHAITFPVLPKPEQLVTVRVDEGVEGAASCEGAKDNGSRENPAG